MRGGLGDAYSATIQRIKAQGCEKSQLGMGALMWISHAERPLKEDELCQALAVELGSTDFDEDNVPSVSTLVGCCQGLITVDKEGSTVRLIHFTLQEHLSICPHTSAGLHSKITEICLTYMNSQQVKAIPADGSHKIGNMPFLQYCSIYWGVHARWGLSDHARSLALQLLRECEGHISTELLLRRAWPRGLGRVGIRSPFTGLHYASLLGVIEAVAALLDIGCYDTDAGDFEGYTPLALAAWGGHEEVVKILLDRGEVNPNKQNHVGQTPLSLAALKGTREW